MENFIVSLITLFVYNGMLRIIPNLLYFVFFYPFGYFFTAFLGGQVSIFFADNNSFNFLAVS